MCCSLSVVSPNPIALNAQIGTGHFILSTCRVKWCLLPNTLVQDVLPQVLVHACTPGWFILISKNKTNDIVLLLKNIILLLFRYCAVRFLKILSFCSTKRKKTNLDFGINLGLSWARLPDLKVLFEFRWSRSIRSIGKYYFKKRVYKRILLCHTIQ